MTSELPLEVDCVSVSDRMKQDPNYALIDCREPDEHVIVRITEAQLLPMSQIVARIAELEMLRDREFAIHCHHGGRSLRVAKWLREQGFRGARSVAGGIDAWAVQIDPKLPRY